MAQDEEAIIKKGVKTPVGFAERKEEIRKSNYASLRKLYCVSFVSVFFIAAQVTGGIMSNSIAIFTDTAHLVSDMIGFAISIISLFTAQKAATKAMSFGYHRAEILGTMTSVIFLWAITIWLLVEATKRFFTPPVIKSDIMLITAVASLFFNLIQIKILHGGDGHYHLGGGHDDHDHDHDHGHDHGHDHVHADEEDSKKEPLLDKDGKAVEEKPKSNQNINITAAYLHVLGDMLMSIGVIIASFVIYFAGPGYNMADPLCTYFFSVLICFTTIPVFKDCILVLMESTPGQLDADEVMDDIVAIEGVDEVHDFHLWSVTYGKYSLSCHITAEEQLKVLSDVTDMLRRKHKLFHTTIQMEGSDDHEHAFKCANDIHE